jgi:hypothetical protein
MLQLQLQQQQAELALTDTTNQRDNETKILVAEINAASSEDGVESVPSDNREQLLEKMREFD